MDVKCIDLFGYLRVYGGELSKTMRPLLIVWPA